MTAEHPFNIPLSELSSEELERRQAQLIQRFRIARQMQMNEDVLNQLDLMMNSIDIEKERRISLEIKQNGVILETDPIEIVQSKFIGKK